MTAIKTWLQHGNGRYFYTPSDALNYAIQECLDRLGYEYLNACEKERWAYTDDDRKAMLARINEIRAARDQLTDFIF